MNSPRSHQPLKSEDPQLRPVGYSGELAEGLDVQGGNRVVHPQPGGSEVIPSGHFPAAPSPTRASPLDEDTEIISLLPDQDVVRRRHKRNRKALSPAKLLAVFLAAQVAIGLLGLAIFGGMIRSWLMADATDPDGVTAEDAAVLREHVEVATADFEKLDKDLTLVKKQIAVSPGDAWAQLDILGKRNQLTMLADDAITNGNRVAFDQLVALSKDVAAEKPIKDGAAAEILRVKNFYASGTRLGSFTLPIATLYPSLKTEKEQSLSNSQLVALLGDRERSWRVRTRAAYLLGSRRELSVCEALVRAAKEDPNLDVVKECVFTFEENTGYRAKGLFEIDELVNWWTVYEARAAAAAAAKDAEADPS